MIVGPKKTVSILLPLDLYNELSQLARASQRTLPGYIRQILKAYLRHAHENQGMEERWLTY